MNTTHSYSILLKCIAAVAIITVEPVPGVIMLGLFTLVVLCMNRNITDESIWTITGMLSAVAALMYCINSRHCASIPVWIGLTAILTWGYGATLIKSRGSHKNVSTEAGMRVVCKKLLAEHIKPEPWRNTDIIDAEWYEDKSPKGSCISNRNTKLLQ